MQSIKNIFTIFWFRPVIFARVSLINIINFYIISPLWVQLLRNLISTFSFRECSFRNTVSILILSSFRSIRISLPWNTPICLFPFFFYYFISRWLSLSCKSGNWFIGYFSFVSLTFIINFLFIALLLLSLVSINSLRLARSFDLSCVYFVFPLIYKWFTQLYDCLLKSLNLLDNWLSSWENKYSLKATAKIYSSLKYPPWTWFLYLTVTIMLLREPSFSSLHKP